MKNIIIFILAFACIALIVFDNLERNEARTEKDRLLQAVDSLTTQNDSLQKQIEARQELISKLDEKSKKLTDQNRILRYEYNQRVKNLSNLNATEHLELFTKNYGD